MPRKPIISQKEAIEFSEANPDLNLQGIGNHFNLSRQRIWQVLPKHWIQRKRKATFYPCAYCGVPVPSVPSRRRKFCSMPHRRIYEREQGCVEFRCKQCGEVRRMKEYLYRRKKPTFCYRKCYLQTFRTPICLACQKPAEEKRRSGRKSWNFEDLFCQTCNARILGHPKTSLPICWERFINWCLIEATLEQLSSLRARTVAYPSGKIWFRRILKEVK